MKDPLRNIESIFGINPLVNPLWSNLFHIILTWIKFIKFFKLKVKKLPFQNYHTSANNRLRKVYFWKFKGFSRDRIIKLIRF